MFRKLLFIVLGVVLLGGFTVARPAGKKANWYYSLTRMCSVISTPVNPEAPERAFPSTSAAISAKKRHSSES